MRQYLVILIVVLFSLSGYSQPKNLNLTIQAGVAIPAFDFAAKNLDNGSFALTGFTGSIAANVILHKNWGAFIQSGLNLSPIDVGDLGYEKKQEDPFLLDVYVRSDPFKVIDLLAGPVYNLKLLDNLNLLAKTGAGVFFSSTPYQLFKTEYFQMGPPYFEVTSSKDISFAYGGGASLIYDIAPCYQIGISGFIMHSQGHFDFYRGNTIWTSIRNITLINFSGGIIIKLR